MKLEFDQSLLEEALKTVVASAVTQGCSSYELRATIAKAAEDAVAKIELPMLVSKHLDSILADQLDGIVKTAAEEAIPALKAAVSMATKQLAARMIFGIRQGPSDWNAKEQEIWKQCVEAVND